MQAWVKSHPGGTDYWASRVSLPGKISQGEEFRLTITWGPSATDNKLYLNGTAMPAKLTNGYDFAGIVTKSSKIVIGALLGGMVDDKPSLYHNQMTSTLVDFKMLDTPTAEELEPLAIASVSNTVFKSAGFSGKLIAGDKAQVEMTGTKEATATFDIARLANADRQISLDWKGYGVYLEDKAFYADDEVDLHEVKGYQVFVSDKPFTAVTADMTPLTTLKVYEQSYLVENLERDLPYYAGVYAEMSDGTLRTVIQPLVGMAMTETATGTYSGEFTVGALESYPEAVVVGHLARGSESASLAENKPFVIDTALTIAVGATPEELKADEKSTAKVTVTVTDANGNPVPGHKVSFVLCTTSQYTGVVGGGAFKEEVGGAIKESSSGETDLFGTVTATYVAGFAAKTAIIVARDMVSNSTGTAVVKTYIQAEAQLTLVDPVESAAALAGYEISVKAGDEWLTADGKSQTRITATVTLAGSPVEGHKVNFSVTGVGSIRTVKDTTNGNGEATAIYTAGKKIGIDVVTAEDVTVGISGSVQIELRSDAPAKISIKIDPESLEADGKSTAELQVLVTDINDNPNKDTEVEYLIASGSGKLLEKVGLTNADGENTNTYVAGRTAGVVTFELTVRSTLPTAEERAAAEDLALLPDDTEYF